MEAILKFWPIIVFLITQIITFIVMFALLRQKVKTMGDVMEQQEIKIKETEEQNNKSYEKIYSKLDNLSEQVNQILGIMKGSKLVQ